MSTRKWLIRSLIPLIIGLLVGGGFYVSAWLKPAYIRQQLLVHLNEKFQDVDIEVGSARLRFFGGISVTDLTFIRKDDPTRQPILRVPYATIQQDKEQLSKGRLVVRKIEMDDPSFVVVRKPDGRLNWAGVVRPPQDNDPVPVFVLRNAKVRFEDHSLAEPRTLDLILNHAVMVNDPSSIYAVEGQGSCGLFGSLAFRGRYDEQNGGFSLAGDLADIPVGPPQVAWLSGYSPAVAEHARELRGRGEIHAEIAGLTQPALKLEPNIRFALKQGSLTHPKFPLPMERLEVAGTLRDRVLRIEKARAKSGESEIRMDGELNLDDPPKTPAVLVGRSGARSPATGDAIRTMNVAVDRVILGDALFRKLPPSLQVIQRMFEPDGPTDIGFHIAPKDGAVETRFTISPRGIKGTYEDFRYPLDRVTGTIEAILVPDRPDTLMIDVRASAKGRPIKVVGSIVGLGQKPDMAVNLTIAGEGIEIDEDLIKALPDFYPALVRRLRPNARGNFTATIHHDAGTRRDYGAAVFDNTFDIELTNSSLNYADFPYALDKVNGKLRIRTVPERPTRLPAAPGMPVSETVGRGDDTGCIEFRDVTAFHAGSLLRINGSRIPATGGSLLTFEIKGESVPFDLELREALSRMHIDGVWQAFDLHGQMNCTILANVFERAKTERDPNPPFVPAEDLALGMAFSGPGIRPVFMPYLLQQLKGQLTYYKGRIHLRNFEARHSLARFAIPEVAVDMRPQGGYHAALSQLTIDSLSLDSELMAALPPGLRKSIETLEVRGPIGVQANSVSIDEKAAPRPPSHLPVAAGPDSPALRQVSYRSEPGPDEEQTPHRSPSPLQFSALPMIAWDGRVILRDNSFTLGLPWRNASGELASTGTFENDRLGNVGGRLVLDHATILRQPVDDVVVSAYAKAEQPNLVIVDGIQARMYGGEVGGEARVLLDEPARFDLVLNAARMKLSEFARQHKFEAGTKLEGLASGRLRIYNSQHTERGLPLLEGIGGIDIDNGSKIFNVPELLNVIKALKLRVPDQTLFDEAHAIFKIRGDQLYFGQIDLLGEAVNLGGEGGMRLDGSNMKLEFYTMSRFHDLMKSPLSKFTAAVSRSLLKISVQGDVGGKLEYKTQAVPLVTDPFKRWIDK